MSESTITETFNIIMQKGIEGGCPPPEPRARYFVTRATGSKIFMISTKVRPEGEDWLKPVMTRKLQITDHHDSIYCRIEDLYGRDTSIVHVTDYTRLADLHLSGSNAPQVPHPTEEQKAKFDEALAILEKWGSPRVNFVSTC
ncbi:hypothetical protein JVT61DRAFT_8157 [Boletus reticuloceps]|uniref:Uncharacterized protein n=1 Tax=Boletus reticuloceps TaxID=495285 RepID=A0A8I3AF33_9AGAM|nr:hypothetical protein JVT61DRAFT_8157 [Boletus reticuloceps]